MPKLQKIRKVDQLEYDWEDNKFQSLIIYGSAKRYKRIIKRLCNFYKLPLIKITSTKISLHYFHCRNYYIYLTNTASVLDLLHEFAHYIQHMVRYPKKLKESQYHNKAFRKLVKEVIKEYRENHI